MSRVLKSDGISEVRKAALHGALDKQSDRIKLRQCNIDLRSHELCIESWWKDRGLPELYTISVSYNGTTTDAYINQHVSVADVFAGLIDLGVLTKKNAFFGCLKSLHDQGTLQLYHEIGKKLQNSRLIVHIRDQISTTMTIFVKDLLGRIFTILASSDDSIELVKGKIILEYGVPVHQQRLLSAGRQLDDTRTLSDYGIQNESTIHLILRLRGGKPIIRLSSTYSHMISNVTVRLDLPSNIWHLSSVYPTPSDSDHTSFVEWNNIQVHPNGQLCFEKQHTLDHHAGRLFPSITDEHEHRMLFWEALTNTDLSFFNLDKGLCVPRHDFTRVLNYLLKKMSFSSEDRDDMITYVIPHLDEADPDYERKNVIFRFLSEEEYSTVAPLTIRPLPERMVRAFLLYGFGDDDESVSNMHDIDEVVNLVTKECSSTSGLIVHEWGSMFVC